MRAPVKLFLATSNPGKLAEYRELAATSPLDVPIKVELLEGFESSIRFEENAPTFAENAVGKALHYSGICDELVIADDSGLVVPSLRGAPGVHSARYAGAHATNLERIEKLLNEMSGRTGAERAAHFVCAIALAREGRALAIVTGSVHGQILEAPRGTRGFGYDPVFYLPALQKTFAEMTQAEKNKVSHRGTAFHRLLAALPSML